MTMAESRAAHNYSGILSSWNKLYDQNWCMNQSLRYLEWSVEYGFDGKPPEQASLPIKLSFIPKILGVDLDELRALTPQKTAVPFPFMQPSQASIITSEDQRTSSESIILKKSKAIGSRHACRMQGNGVQRRRTQFSSCDECRRSRVACDAGRAHRDTTATDALLSCTRCIKRGHKCTFEVILPCFELINPPQHSILTYQWQ